MKATTAKLLTETNRSYIAAEFAKVLQRITEESIGDCPQGWTELNCPERLKPLFIRWLQAVGYTVTEEYVDRPLNRIAVRHKIYWM